MHFDRKNLRGFLYPTENPYLKNFAGKIFRQENSKEEEFQSQKLTQPHSWLCPFLGRRVDQMTHFWFVDYVAAQALLQLAIRLGLPGVLT